MAYDKSRDSFQHAIDLVKFVRRFNESGAHPTAVVSGLELLVFPRDIRPRQIDWLRWIISKQRSTRALIILSRNCFSIIATFSIFGKLRARGRSHPDYRRNHADYLHRRTETHGPYWRLAAHVFLRSYYVLCSLAKMIPRWSGALAFNTRWNNAMILWLIMLPVFISTRSTGRTLPG